MNELMFYLSIIILFLVWRYLYLPQIKGYFRDRLFDLRDDYLRETFVSEYSLEDQAYKTLRDQLVLNIKKLNKLNIIDFFIACYFFLKDDKYRKCFIEEEENRYNFSDGRKNEIAKKVREDSSYLILGYLIFSSFFASLMFIVLCIALGLYSIIKRMPIKAKILGVVRKCDINAIIDGIDFKSDTINVSGFRFRKRVIC